MVITKSEQILPTFKAFVDKIESTSLQKTCAELLTYDHFWSHPASIGHHHAFHRGLILHTLEVCQNAWNISGFYRSRLDLDVVITSCLWHDIGKIWEYALNPVGVWVKTGYHASVHHIPGSMAEFTAVAQKNHVPFTDVIQKVQHCILSHHGCKEFGAIRTPETLEAIIVSQADMLSSISSLYNGPID